MGARSPQEPRPKTSCARDESRKKSLYIDLLQIQVMTRSQRERAIPDDLESRESTAPIPHGHQISGIHSAHRSA